MKRSKNLCCLLTVHVVHHHSLEPAPMKTYLTFMQRVVATAGPQANFTNIVQAVSSAMAGQGHCRSAVSRLQVFNAPLRFADAFPAQPAIAAPARRYAAHCVLTAPSLGRASSRLNQPLARVITVYKSYLVSTGFSASGNTNAVWLNSEL